MFKRTKPSKQTYNYPDQFPHCDQRILHAPNECEYCDRHPHWQALRAAWGIAFTGYEAEGTELPCPADYARGETINYWPGNRAKKEESE